MSGRTANEAFENYIHPLRDALTCVTQHRLTPQVHQRLRADKELAVALNSTRSVPLQGQYDLTIRVAQRVRIESVRNDLPARQRYSVAVGAYVYGFATSNGQEVLSFHWVSESPDPVAIRFPHAHIGAAITAGQTVLRPSDLHHAHIPTGHISLPAVIRLAISEFGVFPLRRDWDVRLSLSEAALSAAEHG